MGIRLALAALAATTGIMPVGAPHAAAQTCAPVPPSGAGVPIATSTPLLSDQTRIHWTRATRRLTYGETGSLEGQVVTDDGAVGGAAVDLYERAGDGSWQPLASTTSDEETGVFGFGCLAPRHTTTYRVVHEGTVLHGPSADNRQMAVARQMPDHMEQLDATRFTFTGAVSPRYAGPVTLERQDCSSCDWRPTDRVRTDRRSRWRFEIDVAGLRGRIAYRATIPADERFARSTSRRTWRITVR